MSSTVGGLEIHGERSLASAFVELRDAALLTAAIAAPIAVVMWSTWDAKGRWSRTKGFVISGAVALGMAVVIVGMTVGIRLWLISSLAVAVWIERSLPSWLVPAVATAVGLIAALLTLRLVMSETTSPWRWLAAIFVPFWAVLWIFWLGGFLLFARSTSYPPAHSALYMARKA
jgi:hypothetical protein